MPSANSLHSLHLVRAGAENAQDLSEFMSDAKLRACSCGTEIRLAWKFEKAAPKTTSVIVDPAGLVDAGVVVTQPVGVGTGALALTRCNECNECNEFADGTRYILVTLSSLVRATFTECNECNEFFSRFLLAEEKREGGGGVESFGLSTRYTRYTPGTGL